MHNLKAVIFDWAGTIVDFGSRAPMGAFVETFADFGLDLSVEEARGPMGMAKRDHIAALLALPRVAAAWREHHATAPDDAAVDRLYAAFLPRNIAVAARHADLIPGVTDVVAFLRAEGLRIGTTTGYTHEIMEEILPVAARCGFVPDCLVCTGDTAAGRPSPLMIYRALLELAVWPARSVIKVDDTEVGIGEGLNAGTWTVGVIVSGNLFGLTEAEVRALPPAEFARRREAAASRLLAAGAHYLIDTVAELPAVAWAIEGRLARGERP